MTVFSTWVMLSYLWLFKCLPSQENTLKEALWPLPFPMPGAECDMQAVPPAQGDLLPTYLPLKEFGVPGTREARVYYDTVGASPSPFFMCCPLDRWETEAQRSQVICATFKPWWVIDPWLRPERLSLILSNEHFTIQSQCWWNKLMSSPH